MTGLFFFNDTATTEIYTLSLHDALPISGGERAVDDPVVVGDRDRQHQPRREALAVPDRGHLRARDAEDRRSEEHTSELQSRQYLVCRLLLEKKKIHINRLA